MVALIAETFHVLPTAVVRDLENDPLQLSLACQRLLAYRNCKNDYDRASSRTNGAAKAIAEVHSNWGKLAEQVEANTFPEEA
jgi:hypothetical protein